MIQAIDLWLSQYNLWLLGLALPVCCAGTYIVAVLMARGLATLGRRRAVWLLFLVPNFGATVWATHFIAMLAFSPGPELFYELNRTVLSAVLVTAGATPPLALALLRPRWHLTAPLSGTGLALAIAAMHFTGMSALRFCGTASFNPVFSTLGVVLCAVLASVTVHQLTHPAGKPRVIRAMLALLGAIFGLHFISRLGHAIVIGGALPPAGATGLFRGDSAGIAMFLVGMSGLILAAAFIAAFADRRITLISLRQAEALNYFAHHDELTRLPNRRQLRERMADLLSNPASCFMLYYIDIDRFKPVNSLFGHATGDRLLLLAAERMRALLGKDDMLGRIGGDEFLLLRPLPDYAGADTALATAIVHAMAEPFQLDETSLRIGASIGIVFANSARPRNPEILLAQADEALSQAKQHGGEQVCLYQPEMSVQRAARRQLEGHLGEAVARGEMFLVFQPLCSSTGQARGFEALLRWRHSERGLVSPVEFIPYAERSGHIRAIGLFVLEQACRAAMGWPAHLRVAVNISAVQLRDESLFGALKDILARTGLPPRRLELEITESALIEDHATVGALLRDMHEFGLELAIDDFGTGYSNLSHLRDFCAGRLKIDRSFISGLRGESDAASIVRAITGLGHALGMKVLAEGVETESELRLVRAMGVDEIQGYYFARPMPQAEILPWLAQTRPAVPPPRHNGRANNKRASGVTA